MMKNERRKVLKWAAVSGAAWLLAGCEKGPNPSIPGKPTVYLTTDDGPLRGSEYIDAAVREYEVPMTAFVVGKHAQSLAFRARLEAYRNNPHIRLGNHSYTHADGHYLDYYRHPQRVLRDFEHNQRALGLSEKIGRLPGRDSWRFGAWAYDADSTARAAADLLAQNGYRLYGWDLEWTHTQSGAPIGTAEQIHQKIIYQLAKGHSFTPGHLVFLMHDQMFRSRGSVEQLRSLLSLLKEDQTIRLRYIDEYPLTAPPAILKKGAAPHLIKAPVTGIGESTPVDPLKFGQ